MRNVFYFTLKALFVLKIFKCLSDFFIMQKSSLNRRLISKLMTSQHIQLIEYNTRQVTLEKSHTTFGEEVILRHFSKNSKLSTSLDQQSRVLYSFFIVWQVQGYQNIFKLRWRSLAFISYKAFLQNKEWSETSIPVSTSA